MDQLQLVYNVVTGAVEELGAAAETGRWAEGALRARYVTYGTHGSCDCNPRAELVQFSLGTGRAGFRRDG